MKKFLALLLAVLMVAAMAACGKENGPADPKDDEPKKSAEYTRGVWEGSVLTNEFTNLVFHAPEGVNIASDEEIAEIMGIALEDIGVSDAYLKAQNIFDAMVVDPQTGVSVIIMAENTALSPGGTKLSEPEYLELVMKGLQSDNDGTQPSGEVYEVAIGSETYYVQDVEIGEGLFQSYLIRRVGKYMNAIILTYVPEVVSFEDMISCFDSVK